MIKRFEILFRDQIERIAKSIRKPKPIITAVDLKKKKVTIIIIVAEFGMKIQITSTNIVMKTSNTWNVLFYMY